MLSMQTKIETPKHLLALPFPFYVSGVFGSSAEENLWADCMNRARIVYRKMNTLTEGT